VRSDQWSFVRQGIPALFVTPGWKGLDEQELERRRAWIRERYHTPRDEWDPAWRWDDAARFARLQFLTAYLVAAEPARPAWNEGDFFERFARSSPRAR
jgi:Zn-dependent M28 family amino/carboxypeptidase